jgi:hypothetical protein
MSFRMRTIDQIIDEFIRVAADDYIGLWMIAPLVRRDLGLSSNADVKARTLDVVRGLLEHGLWPGDFDYGKSKIYFWDEPDAAACLARIDREWDATKGDPPLPESICWFDFKK